MCPMSEGWADRAPTPQHPARPASDFPCCASGGPCRDRGHDGALEAAFRAWLDSASAPCPAPGEDYLDSDLESAFKAGVAWAAGRAVAGAEVIVPVCDLCHMPAVLGDDGHYRHADAANAVFCSLVMQRPR